MKPTGSEGTGKKQKKKKSTQEQMAQVEKRRKALQDYAAKIDSSPLDIELRLLNYFKKNGSDSVRYAHLQEIILHLLGVDKELPKWISVRGKKNISKVVFLIFNSLDISLYASHSQYLPNLVRIFRESCPTKASGCKHTVFSPVHSLLLCPLSKSQRKKRDKELAEFDYSKQFDMSDFLATKEQKEEFGFPMRKPEVLEAGDVYDYDFFKEYVETVCKENTLRVEDMKRDQLLLFAIDCEMCKTEQGFELTRVSVVNEHKNVVYDKYVKPDLPILDYCTPYSGITAKTLENVTYRLQDVQQDLLNLIPKHAVMIGHSFENDLRALQMIHEHVIDTSLIYSHSRGPPFKASLKWLCEKYLHRAIQTQDSGHDSVQDAIATLELALLKLQHGPRFGETVEETEPLSDILYRNTSRRTCLIDAGAVVKKFQRGMGVDTISVENDEEATRACCQALHNSNADFVFVHFRSLQKFFKLRNEADPSNEEYTKELVMALSSMDAGLGAIHEALPENSVFMVTTGHGNMVPVAKMKSQKNVAKEHWTEFDDQELDRLVGKARSCLSFIAPK